MCTGILYMGIFILYTGGGGGGGGGLVSFTLNGS